MLGAYGDIGTLILRNGNHLVVTGDRGGAGDDDPVFGAVHVALHAQALAGFDCDALHLEVIGVLQHGVAAPGSLHGEVGDMFLGVVALEDIYHLAHSLAVASLGNQNGIRRFDDVQVFHTDGGDQTLIALDQGVAAVHGDDVALGGVAGGILARYFMHGVPAPHVGPADVAGNEGDVGCLFQYAVVDGDAGHAREVFGDGLGLLTVSPGGGDVAQHGGDFGQVFGDLPQDGGGLPYEHAGVPVIAAFAQKAFGGLDVRLFGEALHGIDVPALAGACLDIAEAGVGPRRGNAEGDQLAAACGIDGLAQGLLEHGGFLDDVVRRQDHHHRIGAVARQPGGGQGNGGRRVAPHRFEQGVVAV